jgi:hypothetical protein
VAVMVAEVKVHLLVNQSKFLDVAVMDVYCLKKKDDKFINNSSLTPRLPPKTYKHIRQQSS